MIEHGGKLRTASERWGIPLGDWLDLSTGIAPWSYPVPPIPAECWQRLPEEDDGLEAAACAYYGVSHLLPLPGSQAAIQALPRLRCKRHGAGIAAVLNPAYGEYAPAWKAAGHELRPFAADALMQAADSADVVMLANPNNPDGRRFSADDLLEAARRLHLREGWLIVDEAFGDGETSPCLAPFAGTKAAPNLLVLRSVGKFFGLAGARVGFCVATESLLADLHELIGPWAVPHPARFAVQAALADTAWQAAQRLRLQEAGTRLASLLKQRGWGEPAGTGLFQTIFTPDAESIYEYFAQQGILLRHFPQWSALRFGLPADEAGWARLARARAA
ncbi:MAG TPA: threonine-phosphate decarboxylase CobD [Rhodocyclaceae bacterium]|nr:threonine-phosphate decarboxylase CobD [Rhodocyclaceae bacterium]